MAFTYGFFNSMNGDRKYNAEQMSSIFDGILTDGVFSNVGEIMAVVPGSVGLQVVVKTGRAWFNHTWSLNDSLYPISLDEPDPTLTRIDAVVLEVNHKNSVRANEIKYIKGTPAASPSRPSLLDGDDVFQHPLAYVTVAPETTSILGNMIDCRVGQSDCPFATGILAQANIDDLFQIWDANFNQWFDNVKAQLTGNVVTNLQRQIDANRQDIDDNKQFFIDWFNSIPSLATKEIMGIPEDATMDEAFLKLSMGVGNYGYGLKVIFPDGRPVGNVVISGVTTPNGNTARTNVNGEVIVVSKNTSISVTVGSNWVDVNPQSFTVASTGTLTKATLTMAVSGDKELTYSSSTTVTFSDYVTSVDFCAVGGGGGGVEYNPNYSYSAAGGAGGYVSNQLGVVPSGNNRTISVVVGAGGKGCGLTGWQEGMEYHGGSSGGDGGSSYATMNGITQVYASGGTGAKYSSAWPPHGNGNGAVATYGGPSPTNATNGTGYLYNDSSKGVAGGGGGGAWSWDYSLSGGSPYGNGADTQTAPGPGGGGGGVQYYYGSNGGTGRVFIRFHH